MEHNNNIYDFCGDFCGEISEISPNTLSKVAPKTGHFCIENREISPIYDILLEKYIDLMTRRGIVGKQACSL